MTPDAEDLRAAIARNVAEAIAAHGEQAVAFGVGTILAPMLGMIALFQEEQVLLTLGKQYGLTHEQMVDGVALVGLLRGCDDEHKAWLAAEIIARTVPQGKAGLIVAALAGVDAMPSPTTN